MFVKSAQKNIRILFPDCFSSCLSYQMYKKKQRSGYVDKICFKIPVYDNTFILW